MTTYSDILSDTENIDNALDHIKRVAYDAEVRWENISRLGADVATAASSYLTALYNAAPGAEGRRETRKFKEALESAIHDYRTTEAGGFLFGTAETPKP